MNCPICQTSIKHLIKVIDQANVFECDKCQLAVLDKQKKAINELYSFKNYKLQEKRLERRLINLANHITRYIKEGKILDIGAGFGQFSFILANSGRFEIEVVEPMVNPEYLIDQKINIYKTNYENFLSLNRTGVKLKHDLILMMDVLEHFKNPLKNLKKTVKILERSGYLVIQTPNYKSLMVRICKNWSWWMPEDHKFIYSPSSIRKILAKSGFEIVYFQTYEDGYDFKKNLDENFSFIKNSLPRKIFKAIFFLFFTPLYFLFRKVFWSFGLGGLIFLVAKRYNK